jgi:peptidoglycan/LPS O-acetylase OafA/YrhL
MLTSKKLTLLHAVRGFAAFYVVVFHAKFALWSGGKEYLTKYPQKEWNLWDYLVFAVDMLSSNGTAMVIVFFVLSGFFISYSFDKNKWQLKDFYINRLIRIYVPFLFSLFFAIGVLFLVKEINPALADKNFDRQFNHELAAAFYNLNFKGLISSLFFLPFGKNDYIGFNMVYWSLLYEAIFYLLIPITINRLKPYLLFSLLTLGLSYFFSNKFPIFRYFLEFSIYFAAGLSLFHFIKARPGFKPLPALLFAGVLALCFGAVIGLGLINQIRLSHVVAGVLSIGLILYIINYEVRENFITTIFKKLGLISYTLYLFHFPVLILTYAILTKLTGEYLFYERIYWVGVLAAVLISYPVYFLVEDKSLRLISKLKRKPASVPVLK